MFRRTKTETPTTALENKGPGAKGRPTPTRKEAEEARKLKAKAPMDKKAAQKVLRERRTESNAKVRQGMRTGDERYLPARDQGPVKRFIRDFVDARLSIAEFLLPLLIAIMVLQYSRNDRLIQVGASLMTVTLLRGHGGHGVAAVPDQARAAGEVPRREPAGHHLLHDHAGAAGALHADAEAPGEGRRRSPQPLNRIAIGQPASRDIGP